VFDLGLQVSGRFRLSEGNSYSNKKARLTLIFLCLHVLQPVLVLRCDFLEDDFMGRSFAAAGATVDSLESSMASGGQLFAFESEVVRSTKSLSNSASSAAASAL
jgi:hypothetical protein